MSCFTDSTEQTNSLSMGISDELLRRLTGYHEGRERRS